MKRRKTHRLLSLLLCCAVLISMMPMTAAAADSTGTVTVGPSDPAVTITIKDVQAGKLAQDVAYEVKYSDGTTGWSPYAPFDSVERKTPWQVKETGRYLLKNYIAYNGNTLADYDDHFYAGMTYKLVISGTSVQFKGADKIKLVFDNCDIVWTSGTMQKETINDHTCYTLDVKLGGEMKKHNLEVDESIDHVYKRLESGIYEEINLTNNRKIEVPEGTKLKFTVDKDCVSDGGVLKFFKGFKTEIVDPVFREYSSKDKGFIEGNFKVLSESGQEIVLQMGDRDTSISAVFTDDQLVPLNAIYLDVLPAIENGRQVTVVAPSGEATRVAATPNLRSADRLATYTITGKTAGESNPNDNGVYLYKKSTDPNTETDGKYTLEFSVKLNGNFYCSSRTTQLYINGKLVPEKDITQVTGFGNSDSLPVYWSIENRKIEALGCTGWDMDFRLRDFASQYYENTGRYGLGLDDPMDFQKNSEGRYRYGVSGGVPADTTVGAYGSTEAASGQKCTVTFPVAVPESIREWNANHSGEEQIGFTFREGATGGVFVQDADGGSYSPVSATYTVSDPGSDGNVTATATFTPENGKLYRVMGSVAATWQGKIVATTPADNSFIYVKGVAKNYLTGSVVYTSAVRYGDDVSIGYKDGLGAIEGKHLQWQWKNGEAWTDISGATNGALPSAKVNSFVGQQIRVKVTADGYEGVIYSEAKTVSKGTWDKVPVAPELFYDKIAGTVTVTNFKNDQWYLLSEKSTIADALAEGMSWYREGTFKSVAADKTYYVYTCMGEDNAHYMGTVYRYSSIRTGDTMPLNNLTLEGYTAYGLNNKIYIKQGETVEIPVLKQPVNANTWSYFTLKSPTTGEHYSIVEPTTTEITTEIPTTIKLKGETTGSSIIGAYYGSGTGDYYGQWDVVVYDPENITSFDVTEKPILGDVSLSVGDTYQPTVDSNEIKTNPSGALDGSTLKWSVGIGSSYSGWGYGEENDYIKVNPETGEITAKQATGDCDAVYKSVRLYAVKGSSTTTITTYSVIVTATTAPTLESISVVPNEKTLTVGDNVTLTAVKYPANAEGPIMWESSDINSKITVTADTSDNSKATVQVTSDAAPGTYTITAKCGEKQATCTVYVTDTEHTHTYGAWTYDDNFHYKTCTANDDVQAGPHNWEVDTTQTNTEPTLSAPGEKHYKCSVCNATKTDILSKLTAITDAGVSVTAPVYGDTPSGAYASSGEFSVASVDWQPAVSGSFAANTVYTVKVELEVSGSNRFTNATQFTINGQIATVAGNVPANGTESVTLTYTFEATGSSGGGGGGGIVPSSQKPEITIIGSGKADLSADGRTATITAEAGNELVSITLNGQEVAKTDKLTDLKTGDKVVITFRKTTDDSAAITKSIASKVSQMQLIARSSKTGKKNIKVTVKGDAKTTALIKDIQDLGCTVKYKFYRSTRKSADYKTKVTKAVPKYLNTTGKKGTMYYYKARVMVYDKAGKLVAQSELKQCKYANRKWSK